MLQVIYYLLKLYNDISNFLIINHASDQSCYILKYQNWQTSALMEHTDKVTEILQSGSNSPEGANRERPSLFPLRDSVQRRSSLDSFHTVFNPHSPEGKQNRYKLEMNQTDATCQKDANSQTQFQFKTPNQSSLFSSPRWSDKYHSNDKSFPALSSSFPNKRAHIKQEVDQQEVVQQKAVQQEAVQQEVAQQEAVQQEKGMTDIDLQIRIAEERLISNSAKVQTQQIQVEKFKCLQDDQQTKLQKYLQQIVNALQNLPQNKQLLHVKNDEGPVYCFKISQISSPIIQQDKQSSNSKNNLSPQSLEPKFNPQIIMQKAQNFNFLQRPHSQTHNQNEVNDRIMKEEPTADCQTQSQVHQLPQIPNTISLNNFGQKQIREFQDQFVNNSNQIHKQVLSVSWVEAVNVQPCIPNETCQYGINTNRIVLTQSVPINYQHLEHEQVYKIQNECQTQLPTEQLNQVKSTKKQNAYLQSSLFHRLQLISQCYQDKVGITKQCIPCEQQTEPVFMHDFAQQTEDIIQKQHNFTLHRYMDISTSYNYGLIMKQQISKFQLFMKQMYEKTRQLELNNRKPAKIEQKASSKKCEQVGNQITSKKSHANSKRNIKNFACQYDPKDADTDCSIKRVSIGEEHNTTYEFQQSKQDIKQRKSKNQVKRKSKKTIKEDHVQPLQQRQTEVQEQSVMQNNAYGHPENKSKRATGKTKGKKTK